MLYAPLNVYTINVQPIQLYPGIGLIQQVSNINVMSLTNIDSLYSQYRYLTKSIFNQIPGLELVSYTDEVFSYSNFWHNVNIWFNYFSISSYTRTYNQLFNLLLAAGNDQFAILDIKKDSYYADINILRENSLIPLLPFTSLYNAFTVFYGGLPFYMFPSLVANVQQLASTFQDIVNNYGNCGLQVYALSNQYSSYQIQYTEATDKDYDYVDLNNNYYLPFYSYIENNDIYTNISGTITSFSNIPLTINMLQQNSNTSLQILPDGETLVQYNIASITTSINNIIENYLSNNLVLPTTNFHLLHALSNTALNIYDLFLFNNFNILKSDITTILSTSLPSLTLQNYFYSSTITFDNILAPFLVPVMSNTNIFINSNTLQLSYLPVMPNPNIETDWNIVLPKYAPIYSDTINFEFVGFSTYIFNKATSSFRNIYEFDVPLLNGFAMITSDTYNYNFNFDALNISGPMVVRLNTATYALYIRTPNNYQFSNITGSFNSYTYYPSTSTSISNVDTFVLYYDTSIFDQDSLIIELSYTSTVLTSNPALNSYTYPSITIQFSFIPYIELYFNNPLVYNMQSYQIFCNLMQMPSYYQQIYKNALNSFYIRDYIYSENTSSLTNALISTPVLTESITLCSASYIVYNNYSSSIFYEVFSDYYLCFNALNTLNSAIQSATDMNSLDNLLIYYNTYARQNLDILLMRPYYDTDYKYYSISRNVLFNIIPTLQNYIY